MERKTNIEFNIEIMQKRIEDDLFWLPSVAIHLLEKDDITGAYRVVKALNDLKTLKSCLEDMKEETDRKQEVLD